MTDYLQDKNAAEVTHFLKEMGGGSMKKGIQNLFDESLKNKELSLQLANSVKSGNIKNGVIVGLTVLFTCSIIFNLKNSKQKNNNIVVADVKKAKEAVENMSEEEIQEMIENSIDDTHEVLESKGGDE